MSKIQGLLGCCFHGSPEEVWEEEEKDEEEDATRHGFEKRIQLNRNHKVSILFYFVIVMEALSTSHNHMVTWLVVVGHVIGHVDGHVIGHVPPNFT